LIEQHGLNLCVEMLILLVERDVTLVGLRALGQLVEVLHGASAPRPDGGTSAARPHLEVDRRLLARLLGAAAFRGAPTGEHRPAERRDQHSLLHRCFPRAPWPKSHDAVAVIAPKKSPPSLRLSQPAWTISHRIHRCSDVSKCPSSFVAM